ncbi:MAG: hypothetical protein WA001_05085 [Patescibacteria group bacterium]
MANINLTHDQVRSKLFGMSSLSESTRSSVADLIIHLSDAGDWYPESFRRGLQSMQGLGSLTDNQRHELENVFFPGHAW